MSKVYQSIENVGLFSVHIEKFSQNYHYEAAVYLSEQYYEKHSQDMKPLFEARDSDLVKAFNKCLDFINQSSNSAIDLIQEFKRQTSGSDECVEIELIKSYKIRQNIKLKVSKVEWMRVRGKGDFSINDMLEIVTNVHMASLQGPKPELGRQMGYISIDAQDLGQHSEIDCWDMTTRSRQLLEAWYNEKESK